MLGRLRMKHVKKVLGVCWGTMMSLHVLKDCYSLPEQTLDIFHDGNLVQHPACEPKKAVQPCVLPAHLPYLFSHEIRSSKIYSYLHPCAHSTSHCGMSVFTFESILLQKNSTCMLMFISMRVSASMSKFLRTHMQMHMQIHIHTHMRM